MPRSATSEGLLGFTGPVRNLALCTPSFVSAAQWGTVLILISQRISGGCLLSVCYSSVDAARRADRRPNV